MPDCSGFNVSMFAVEDFLTKFEHLFLFCKHDTIRFKQSQNSYSANIKPPQLDHYEKPQTFSTAKLKPLVVIRIHLIYTVFSLYINKSVSSFHYRIFGHEIQNTMDMTQMTNYLPNPRFL
jgi:sensor histidine kinase YesM